MNRKTKKLQLNRETLRSLESSELALAMGGYAVPDQPATQLQLKAIPATGGNSVCYCGSTTTVLQQAQANQQLLLL